jgi:hypothetical protein
VIGFSKFTCSRCEFVNNKASDRGGALTAVGTSAVVVLSQTVFRGNTATGLLDLSSTVPSGGGAISNTGGQLSIDRSLFIANSAPNGCVGAVTCHSCAMTLTNSIVAQSSAECFGAVYLGFATSALIEATTFLDNTVTEPGYAQYGSAVSVFHYVAAKAKVTVRDSILWAPGASPLVGRPAKSGFTNIATLVFSNTIVGDGPQACPASACGGNVTAADPRLVQVALTRPIGAFGRPDVYWAPGLGSPAIGGGGNEGGAAVDFLGNPRVSRVPAGVSERGRGEGQGEEGKRAWPS